VIGLKENDITLEQSLTPIGDYWPDPLRDIFSKINRITATTFVNRICEVTGYSVTESQAYFEELINAGVIQKELNGLYHITTIEEETEKRSKGLRY